MNFRVIAELGSNWWQPDPKDAYRLTIESLHAAKEAGAHALKLQLFRANSLYSRDRAPVQWAKAKQFEFPLEWLPDLRREADATRIELWASCFDPETVCKASPLLHGLKIASGDITYKPLLETVARVSEYRKLPVALSTGAATIDEIRNALEIIGITQSTIILMHCVSAYPCPSNKFNLDTITYLRNDPLTVDFIGFSDHSVNDDLPAQLAYALGARWFEVHFGLTPFMHASPDYKVSRNDNGLRVYVESLKKAEAIMGQPKEAKIDPVEADERIWARRGIDGLRPNL